MYSQTGWTDQAEILRIVKGVDLQAVYKFHPDLTPMDDFTGQ